MGRKEVKGEQELEEEVLLQMELEWAAWSFLVELSLEKRLLLGLALRLLLFAERGRVID